MKTATICYDVSMSHWPPDCHLIKVEPSVVQYHPLTGKAVNYHEYLALQVPRPEMNETEVCVYPATEAGDFIDNTLAPLLIWPGVPLHSVKSVVHTVLNSMGYTVSN